MRLLSMDYQRQWLQETRLKEEEQRSKAKVRGVERYPTLQQVHSSTRSYTGEAVSSEEEA